MESTIRPYEPGDRDACRALWRELTEHHRELYADPGIGGADPGGRFDQFLEHPHFVAAWVAARDGEVVGLTGLMRGEDGAEIEPVVVSRPARSQGIGRRLVEHVIAEARRRGESSLSIRPVARNAAAIRHFLRAGFSTVGRVELFQSLASSDRAWRRGVAIHGLDLRC